MALRFSAAVVLLGFSSLASSFKLMEQDEAAKYGTLYEAPGDSLSRLVRPATDDLARQIDESTEALNSGIGAGVTAMNTAFGNLRNGTKAVVHDLSGALKAAGQKILKMEKKVQTLRAQEGNRSRRSRAHRAAALLEQGAAVGDELSSEEAAQRPRRPTNSQLSEARAKAAKQQVEPAQAEEDPEEGPVRPEFAEQLIDSVHGSTKVLNSGIGMGISTVNKAFGELRNSTKSVAHDISGVFKTAGEKIMELERKVEVLRERKAAHGGKKGALKSLEHILSGNDVALEDPPVARHIFDVPVRKSVDIGKNVDLPGEQQPGQSMETPADRSQSVLERILNEQNEADDTR